MFSFLCHMEEVRRNYFILANVSTHYPENLTKILPHIENAKQHKMQHYQLQAAQMDRLSSIHYLFFGDQAPQTRILFRTWKLLLGIRMNTFVESYKLYYNVSEMCACAYLNCYRGQEVFSPSFSSILKVTGWLSSDGGGGPYILNRNSEFCCGILMYKSDLIFISSKKGEGER
jgi:hypothetical protein